MDRAAPAVALLPLKRVDDERGSLIVGAFGSEFPFMVARVFWLRGPPGMRVARGGHAHRTCAQILIPICGRVGAWCGAGTFPIEHVLRASEQSALLVPPMVWLDVVLDDGACLMVLASELYDEADYIRSKEEFDDSILRRSEAERGSRAAARERLRAR
jgi:UDP-2-acetamido-3-amino-2,3-dideoxy-glucuronate N-acetyltransferase